MNRFKSHVFAVGCVLTSLCSQAWAANLPIGQTTSGTIGSAAQTNSYTFDANANNVVDLTMVTTSGNLVPKIQLYNSEGTVLATAYNNNGLGGCGSGSTVEMNTVTLAAAGTYTVIIGDCSDTNTGSYLIYAQLTNNPSGAAALSLGQTQTGTVGSAAQSSTYTFTASANDVVDFTLVTTNGNLIPKIRLYNPAGVQVGIAYNNDGLGGCGGGATVEMNTVALTTAGVYTALVGDCGDTNAGSFLIYSQRTNNPAGAVGLIFGGQTQTGAITSTAESNSYTFVGNANEVIDLTMVTTTGTLIPKIRLYNPAGAQLSIVYNNDGLEHAVVAPRHR